MARRRPRNFVAFTDPPFPPVEGSGGPSFRGSAGVDLTFNFDLNTTWTVQGYVEKSLITVWNVKTDRSFTTATSANSSANSSTTSRSSNPSGSPTTTTTKAPKPMYWYRVQGAKQKQGCANSGFDTGDSTCDSGKMQYTQLVAASGVEELGKLLKKSFIAQPLVNWKIDSIKQYSQPIYSTKIDSQTCLNWKEASWKSNPDLMSFHMEVAGGTTNDNASRQNPSGTANSGSGTSSNSSAGLGDQPATRRSFPGDVSIRIDATVVPANDFIGNGSVVISGNSGVEVTPFPANSESISDDLTSFLLSELIPLDFDETLRFHGLTTLLLSTGLNLSGSADALVPDRSYTAQGGINITGQALTRSSRYISQSSGAILVQGGAIWSSSNFQASGSGHLVVESSYDLNIARTYIGGGSVDIGGDADTTITSRHFGYTATIANNVLKPSGSASCENGAVVYDSQSRPFYVDGSAEVQSSAFNYLGTGGLTFRSEGNSGPTLSVITLNQLIRPFDLSNFQLYSGIDSAIVTCNYIYNWCEFLISLTELQSEGLELSEMVDLGLDTCTLGLRVGGNADARKDDGIILGLHPTGSALVVCSGSALPILSTFITTQLPIFDLYALTNFLLYTNLPTMNYIADVSTSPRFAGSALITSDWIPTPEETWRVTPAIFNISPAFVENISDYARPINWSSNDTIPTNCNCDTNPVSLYMKHEFAKFGPLGTFIKRNYLTFPSLTTLTRNKDNWEQTFHFRGVGLNSSTTEKWDMRFTWDCARSLDGTDITGYVWQFSAIISRTIVETGKRAQSKFTFAFTPTLCFAGQLSAGFTYHGLLDTVSTSDTQCVLVDVRDGIGLQYGNDWAADPNLRISITDVVPNPSPPKFALSALNTITR